MMLVDSTVPWYRFLTLGLHCQRLHFSLHLAKVLSIPLLRTEVLTMLKLGPEWKGTEKEELGSGTKLHC